jgi:hypothetical protein
VLVIDWVFAPYTLHPKTQQWCSNVGVAPMQLAHAMAKTSRAELSSSLADVSADKAISMLTRRKARMEALLAELVWVQGAEELREAIRRVDLSRKP